MPKKERIGHQDPQDYHKGAETANNSVKLPLALVSKLYRDSKEVHPFYRVLKVSNEIFHI